MVPVILKKKKFTDESIETQCHIGNKKEHHVMMSIYGLIFSLYTKMMGNTSIERNSRMDSSSNDNRT